MALNAVPVASIAKAVRKCYLCVVANDAREVRVVAVVRLQVVEESTPVFEEASAEIAEGHGMVEKLKSKHCCDLTGLERAGFEPTTF